MAELKIGTGQNSVTYKYDRMPAAECMGYLTRLLKIIGNASSLINLWFGGEKENSSEKSAERIAEAMRMMDDKEVSSFLLEMAEKCTVNGQPAVVGHTPYDIEETLQVAFFTIRAEFGNFFTDSGLIERILGLRGR